MHLVWPALGATAAVLVCLLASAGVMQATNEQRPDSLAGIIGYLASPGSNVNPARIDGFTTVPRRHESADWPLASEDAVLALSAVVTREGRIQSIEMLAAEQARALKVKPEVVLAMLDAASRAQFEPARAGGAPIAVSMVWLLAHTTVVGREADVDRLMRPLVPPAPGLARARRGRSPSRRAVAEPVPSGARSSAAPIAPTPSDCARASAQRHESCVPTLCSASAARTTSVLPAASPSSRSVTVSRRPSSRPSAG